MRCAVIVLAAAAALCNALQVAPGARPGPARTPGGKKERTVSLTLEQIAERAIAALPASQKETTVLYLDSEPVHAGAPFPAGRETLEAPWDAYVAFADLQPTANWGHPCLYLLVNRQTGEIKKIESSFPPFLKGPVKTLRVIWRGGKVPDWAVAVR